MRNDVVLLRQMREQAVAIIVNAIKNNLAAHPVTGVLFLAHRILANQANFLAEEYQNLVMKAYNDLRGIFGVKGDIMAMLLRIGEAPEPSAQKVGKAGKTDDHVDIGVGREEKH